MKKLSTLALILALGTLAYAQKPELILPSLHSTGLLGMTCSADGRYLVSAASKDLKIWEASSGKLIRTLSGNEQINFSLGVISKDAKWLATAGDPWGYESPGAVNPSDLTLWNPANGNKIRVVQRLSKGQYVESLEFGVQQNILLAVIAEEGKSQPNTELFDLKAGAKLQSFPGFGTLSDDEKHLVLQQENALIRVETGSGATETIIEEACLKSRGIGETVVFLTRNGRLKRWEAASQTIVSDFDLHLDPELLEQGFWKEIAQFSTDGTRFAVSSIFNTSDGPEGYQVKCRYRIFDTMTGNTLSNQSGPVKYEVALNAYSPDLKWFFSAPRGSDMFDTRSLIVAYATANGKMAHHFGASPLTATAQANVFAPEIEVYNEGKIIYFNRDNNGFFRPSSAFLTDRGRLTQVMGKVADREEYANGKFKALKTLTENGVLNLENRWQITCEDGLSYQIRDASSQKTLATLLIAEPGDSASISSTWAIVTPAGLFDASPDMMQGLHFVSGMEIIDLDQLKERYYEPGLLGKIFGLNKEAPRSTEGLSDVALYPEIYASLSDDKLKLQVNMKPRSGGIGKLSVFVNGKEMQEDANPGRATSLDIDLSSFAPYYLAGTSNKLALRVYNEAGWLKSPAWEMDYMPPPAARGNGNNTPTPPLSNSKAKPSLYALVVGTSNYAGDKLDLKFADLDALAFSQALRAAAPKVFNDRVSITLLSTDDKEPTRQEASSKASIKAAFAAIAAKAQAQDVLVVYFSGHGINYGAAEKGQFYYLTTDIASDDLKDPEIREKYTVSSAEITEWIKSIAALKQVMVLDACNSGKIVEDLAGRRDLSASQIRALDRMKDRTGMYILTGSAADKVSFEATQYGQGLLTYSLLQGMSGMALTSDKRVDVMTLFQYSRDKVPELAKGIGGIQTPILAFPAGGASFDIGIVDGSVKIPLTQEKPVFIRSTFQDEDTFDDVLGLNANMAAYFQQITVEGAQAGLIYVDVPEYENAYALKGRYKINGDAVELQGRLFKGKTSKGEFKISGKKNDLPGLVEAIMDKASGFIGK